MNHGLKLHPDGTLEITMPKGVKVCRVLVQEEVTQNGALYYSDGLMEQYKWERDIAISQLKDLGYELGEKPRKKNDVPYTELIDWINECIADSRTTPIEKAILTAVKCKVEGCGAMSGVVRILKDMPSAEPERWSTCFDCLLSHGCPIIKGCTNEQAMQYAGEIPGDCPINYSELPNSWIPCSERLPNGKEWEKAYIRPMHASEFIVMIKGGNRPTTLYLTRGGIWIDENHKEYEVAAWMPLPAPYQPKEDEE